MKREEFVKLLKSDRIVAAIKDEDGLKKTLTGRCQIVFVLYGDIVSIPDIITKIKNSVKIVLVHIDLIDGLSSRDVTVDYIAKKTCADGIISTRPNIIKRAKSHDLLAVQRFFVLDSIALDNISEQISQVADAIEILPGVMPKIIKRIAQSVDKPIIAGGLITDKEDVINALNAGAYAISSSRWDTLFRQNI